MFSLFFLLTWYSCFCQTTASDLFHWFQSAQSTLTARTVKIASVTSRTQKNVTEPTGPVTVGKAIMGRNATEILRTVTIIQIIVAAIHAAPRGQGRTSANVTKAIRGLKVYIRLCARVCI